MSSNWKMSVINWQLYLFVYIEKMIAYMNISGFCY